MSHEQSTNTSEELAQSDGLTLEQREAYKEFSNYIRVRLNEMLPHGIEEWPGDVYSLAETLTSATPEDFENTLYVDAQIERAGISAEAKEAVLRVVADYRDAIYSTDEVAPPDASVETTAVVEREIDPGFDETEVHPLDDAYDAFVNEGRQEVLDTTLLELLNQDFASKAEAAEAIMFALAEVALAVDRGDDRGVQLGIPVKIGTNGKIGFVSLEAYNKDFDSLVQSTYQYEDEIMFRPTPNNELMQQVLVKHFVGTTN